MLATTNTQDVGSRDAGGDAPGERAPFREDDCFALFAGAMATHAELFSPTGGPEAPVLRLCRRFQGEQLRRVEPRLAAWLEECGVEAQSRRGAQLEKGSFIEELKWVFESGCRHEARVDD